MEYVLIGVVAGSLVVSEHKDREACVGRQAMLKEQNISATCVPRPSNTSGLVTIAPAICGNCR